MFPRFLLRPLLALSCLPSLSACAQSAPGAPPAVAAAAPIPAGPPSDDPGSGPDDGAVELPPDGWHGNWRLVAADDPHGHALMALTLQSSAGEAEGSGDYMLFQPFCDALADVPISGTADCELIGLAASFDHVQATPTRIVLVFHPTADRLEHRLELRRDGDRLAGVYVLATDDLRRAVWASRMPEDRP